MKRAWKIYLQTR